MKKNGSLSREQTFLITGALVIGIAAGGVNYLFTAFYDEIYIRAVQPFIERGVWLFAPLFVGAALLIAVSKIPFAPKDLLGFGFPRFIERINLGSGIVRGREAIVRALASIITLGFGGSAGQEGPIAQTGGAIGSAVGRRMRLSKSNIRTFIACGTAAAIAATFNAPITGVMFSEEIVLLRNLRSATFIPIVISSASATAISYFLKGNTPLFDIPDFSAFSLSDLAVFYLPLGIVTGLLAAGFIKMFSATENLFQKIGDVKIRLFTGAAILGCTALLLPEVLGNGYEHVQEILTGNTTLLVLAAILLLKPLATCVTVGSGWPGGLFAPAIFMGAAAGGTFAKALASIMSTPAGIAPVFATVGMGAFLAAITHAPLTSIFLILELTHTYNLIVPAMVCIVTSWVVARALSGGSIEALELKKEGVEISGIENESLHSLRVRDVMRTTIETIDENTSLRKLIEDLPASKFTTFPIVNADGELSGIVSIQDFRQWLFQEDLKDLLLVKEFATLDVTTVCPDDNLYEVVKILGQKPAEILPVVETRGSKKLVGILSRRDVIEAYNKAVAVG
ncbi:chloride channel protein [Candidatus Mycalebacterium sp.]